MKKLFISFLSIFLSFFAPFNISVVNQDVFLEKCQSGYNSYHVVNIEETDQYYLQVIEGEINGEVTYSMLFISSTPKEYTLVLKTQASTKDIFPTTDSRGDVTLYNVKFKKNITIEVRTKGITTYSFDIEIKEIEQYLLLTNVIKGDGLGLERSEINGIAQNDLTKILSIIFTIIIFISIMILLILFKTKKGFFNKDVIDKEFEEQHKTRDEINNYIKDQQNVFEVEAEEIKEDLESKQVYNKVKDEDNEEDDERDISELLRAKGFNTNYNMLLTHEKNEVMLELMKMKNFKEITEEEYKKEIIKLWM